ILGLGNLGPLASKPVMEGKALLFKRFAGLDSIDIEVKHRTIDEFVDTVANIADTFGGINLEDIKAPDCFEIEKRLIESGELSRTSHTPAKFDSPESFVNSMKPYAEKAAKALGVEPSLLLAQAALETGWGQKVVQNARGSSNNLFNIKADRSWQGDKVTTQTLEFHDNTPVKETAAFR
ncbi:glucosaminidase domain-containing protein, partial [Vibrio sp. 2128(2023)]